MQVLHLGVDKNADNERKLPGYYFLLTHSNPSLRSWAVKMVQDLQTITAEQFMEVVEPIFRAWVKVRDVCAVHTSEHLCPPSGDPAGEHEEHVGLCLGKAGKLSCSTASLHLCRC